MKALVIGGTGPSGPHTVNGLIERGYEVTVLHGGQHEVEFVQPIEHIHTDPHFAETLAPALAGRSFDLVLATYGRMRIIADLLKGKTGRFIGVGGSAVYAPRDDPRWGPLGQPVLVPEDSPRCDDPSGPKFNHLMWVTEETVHAGASRRPLQRDLLPLSAAVWCERAGQSGLEHRAPDARRPQADRARGQRPAAAARLCAQRRPRPAAGRRQAAERRAARSTTFATSNNTRSASTFEFIARHLQHECEIVEVPPALAHRVYKGGAAALPAARARVRHRQDQGAARLSRCRCARRRACRRGRLAGGQSPRARRRDRAPARRPVRLCGRRRADRCLRERLRRCRARCSFPIWTRATCIGIRRSRARPGRRLRVERR